MPTKQATPELIEGAKKGGEYLRNLANNPEERNKVERSRLALNLGIRKVLYEMKHGYAPGYHEPVYLTHGR